MIAPELLAVPEFTQVGGKKRSRPGKGTKRKGKGRKGSRRKGTRRRTKRS